MRTIFSILLISVIVSGCGIAKILSVQKEQIVIMPPDALFQCPDIPEPPQGQYTQKDIADWVLRMYQSHRVCKDALHEVRIFLDNAQKVIDAK